MLQFSTTFLALDTQHTKRERERERERESIQASIQAIPQNNH